MSDNTPHCSKKYYKSSCVVINIVTINSATRNTAKFFLTFLTLAGTIRSSEVVTNMMNESVYVSSKPFDVADSLEEIVKSNDNDSAKGVEISKETIENISKIIESEKKKDSEKNLEKSSKSNEKKAIKAEKEKETKICESPKKSEVKAQNKMTAQPEVQKIEPEKKDVDLSNAIVLKGDATAYAYTGRNMANGQAPKAGVHCAMRREFIGKRARVVTASGQVFDLEVGDTGGALRKGSAAVDIYLGGVKECKAFGRQKCTVYVY